MPKASGRSWAALASWSAAHLAVDAVCAFVLFSALRAGSIAASWALVLVVLYDAIAFALQPVVGLVLDGLGIPCSLTAALGGLVTAAGVGVLAVAPAPAAVVAAGLGNAVFHVGGGVASLTLESGRARAAGIFVAPGAVGLLLGTRLAGEAGAGVVLAAVLVALCLGGVLVSERRGHAAPAPLATPASESALLLVLLVIAARSYIGMALALPWRSQPVLLIALTLAIASGKAVGGLAADALGRLPVAATALALAAPLLLLAPSSPPAGIASMLLLNMTMPVTLVALADGIPGRPGFAFGLSCLALVVGALPPLVSPLARAAPWSAAVLACIALVALGSALRSSRRTPAFTSPVVRTPLFEGEDA